MKRYIISWESSSMAFSSMIGTAKKEKKKENAIWYFFYVGPGNEFASKFAM